MLKNLPKLNTVWEEEEEEIYVQKKTSAKYPMTFHDHYKA